MKETIFLTTDETNFLNPNLGFFIPGFLPSLPREEIPKLIRYPLEKFMFYKIPHKTGEVFHCVYGLRKIEAILLEAGLNCKVYSPQIIEKYSEDAAIFGVYTMDPLGIGPVTSTLQGIFGDKRYNIFGDSKYYKPPYTCLLFQELIKKLKRFDKPIVVGGPGTCQFDLFPNAQEELGIDHVVIGDAELVASDIFRKMIAGKKIPKVVHCQKLPLEIKIPVIKKPVSWGLVEISRGCDRQCKFCDPTLKRFSWIPKSQIIKESKVNLRINSEICLMSEDVFRYGTKPRQWVPNWGFVDLIREIKHLSGLKTIALSHGTFAAALSAPDQIEALKEELNLSKENYASIQPGIETGAIHIIKEFMPFKAAPFDSEQWQEVVIDGWRLLAKNYIYPAATLMIGLNDSEEDVQETISLMKKITRYPGMFWPLFFSPLGTLKEKHRYFTDWTQMSPSVQELYLLAIKYLLNQSEKMHQHLFGTNHLGRAFNHFLAIFVKSIIDYVEMEKYTKDNWELKKITKTFIKEFVKYSRNQFSLLNYKARFHESVVNA